MSIQVVYRFIDTSNPETCSGNVCATMAGYYLQPPPRPHEGRCECIIEEHLGFVEQSWVMGRTDVREYLTEHKDFHVEMNFSNEPINVAVTVPQSALPEDKKTVLRRNRAALPNEESLNKALGQAEFAGAVDSDTAPLQEREFTITIKARTVGYLATRKFIKVSTLYARRRIVIRHPFTFDVLSERLLPEEEILRVRIEDSLWHFGGLRQEPMD